MSLPSDFDAATFLYLNPELQAYSNVYTIELARDYFLSSSSSSNLAYNMAQMPSNFDGRIFIADNKDGLNISQLNNTIKVAMSNDGFSKYDMDVFSQYLPTVYKDLRLLDTNVFAFKNLDYAITSNNLIVGDEIKIGVNNVLNVFSKVVDIDSNLNVFTVSNYYTSSLSNSDDKYLLIGHKIYDFDRLSRANYVRNNRSSNPIYGDFSNRFYGLDPDFNVTFYKMLYPDARLLTDEQCVLDYTSRRNNNDVRVGKSDELVKSIDYVYTELRNLHVSCNCKVDHNLVLAGYWVNGITNNKTRPSSQATDVELITEKASKGYLDIFKQTTMDLNNLTVNSNSTFCNAVEMFGTCYIQSNLTLSNNMQMTGNAFISSNMFIGNNLSLSNDFVTGCNAFIGNDCTISNNLIIQGVFSLQGDCEIHGRALVHKEGVFGSNVSLSNNGYIGNSLFVGSNVSMSNNLQVCGNTDVLGYVNIAGNNVVQGNMQVSGSNHIVGTVTIESNTSIDANLDVWQTVNVGSNIALSNNLFVGNATVMIGELTLYGSATLCNNIVIEKDVIVGQSLNVGSNISLSNNLKVLKNIYVNCNLSLSNNLYVNGDGMINGKLYGLCNVLAISGDTDVSGNFIGYSNGTFCNNLNVVRDITAQSIVVSSTAQVTGFLQGLSNFEIKGVSTFSNAVTIIGNTSLESNLSLTGTMNIGTSNTWGTLLVDVMGGIRADDYLITSDARVKKEIKTFDNTYCTNFIKNAPVISYKLKYDPCEREKYGFLAHEMEQLDKNVVANIRDFIPNIMKQCVVKADWIVIKKHELKKGDRVKIVDGRCTKVVKVVEIKTNSVRVDASFIEKSIFVYGPEIQDFKALDYTQLFAISVGALQNTIARVTELETRLASFQ